MKGKNDLKNFLDKNNNFYVRLERSSPPKHLYLYEDKINNWTALLHFSYP